MGYGWRFAVQRLGNLEYFGETAATCEIADGALTCQTGTSGVFYGIPSMPQAYLPPTAPYVLFRATVPSGLFPLTLLGGACLDWWEEDCLPAGSTFLAETSAVWVLSCMSSDACL